MKLIINFFRGLFDSDGNVSSKRFAGVLCIVVCAIAFLANLFFKFIVDHHLFDAFLLFAATCFGMNTYIKQKGMDVKENVATDIIKSDATGANAVASEVLQAQRP